MRIAVIAPPWVPVPPPAYGGTERVLDVLCRALVAQGHDVLLYATGDSACPVERAWTYDEALGTDRAAPAAELRHVLDAYAAARRWGADVVHDHTVTGPVLASRDPNLAIVTTVHGPFDADHNAVYREVAATVPVIAISQHQAATARGVDIAAVIHHAVDLDAYPVGDGAGGYAVFVGRMSVDKGVHVAIRVARAAGYPLRIAAKMRQRDEREYFEERVKPLLGADIDYLGEVGGNGKLALLGGAACLLNPIAWPEPFGMVMIEALACGTPVVVTPRGAAPELVDDGVTGFLRSDEESLAVALGRVGGLDRRACREAVSVRFSAERLATDHIAVYREAVQQRRLRIA